MTSRYDAELEARMRDALEGGSGDTTPSAVEGVLARIGGRSPSSLAAESVDRSLRKTCAVAAGVFVMLLAVSLVWPRSTGRGAAYDFDPSGFGDGLTSGGLTIDEYFGEYSSEATILESLFAEETLQ